MYSNKHKCHQGFTIRVLNKRLTIGALNREKRLIRIMNREKK